jgi:hypothetical protein
LHCQNSFDYPGKFPEGASRKRHYPFKAALSCAVFHFRKLFIIILRKPLLDAMFRLIDISLLPVNTNTSWALADISK